MSNQPYLYDPKANVLRQRAKYVKPDGRYYETAAAWSEAMKHYNAHLASLPAYTPVSGWVPEVGKEYIKDVHFRLEAITHKCHCPCHRNKLMKHIKSCCENGVVRTGMFRAVPMEQKQEQPLTFTLADMIECWEAGRKSGFWTPILSRADKKQYFKTKFNINIDDLPRKGK